MVKEGNSLKRKTPLKGIKEHNIKLQEKDVDVSYFYKLTVNFILDIKKNWNYY